MGVLAVAGVALFPVLGAGELAELGVARSVLVMAVYVVILTALLRLFTIPTATPGTQWSAWPGRRPA